MKTQNRFRFSMAAFFTLSLVSLKVYPAGQAGSVRPEFPGTIPGVAANPSEENVSPAFQKCGKNYVETKLETFPLEGQNPETEGGAWWACQLKPAFNYSNYDPYSNACPAVPGEESELRTEGLIPVTANSYGCSYKEKKNPPTVQCMSGFHAIDVRENKTGMNPTKHFFQTGGFAGQKITHYFWTSYEYYVYDTNFTCVRNGAAFPDGDFNADEDACNPNTSWLGVRQGLWQGHWPFLQICGWRQESSAPLSSGPGGQGPEQAQLPLNQMN